MTELREEKTGLGINMIFTCLVGCKKYFKLINEIVEI
jgi:hypothetical protein